MHSEINKAAAASLRGLRAERKLTLEEVAEQSGVNKDTICRYENGMVSIQLYILDKLLKFYGVKPYIFFASVNDKMQNIEKEE